MLTQYFSQCKYIVNAWRRYIKWGSSRTKSCVIKSYYKKLLVAIDKKALCLYG